MFEMICKMQPIIHCQLEGVSSEVIDEGYKKTIVLCKDMLNRQMYYVLNTGRHVTLTGIMYKLSRLAHAV